MELDRANLRHSSIKPNPPARLTGWIRCFARCQPIRAICVEAQDPVAHDLQCDPGKLRRVAPAATVQDQRYGQQSSNLVRIAASSRKPP
jgi:hypothetical protein